MAHALSPPAKHPPAPSPPEEIGWLHPPRGLVQCRVEPHSTTAPWSDAFFVRLLRHGSQVSTLYMPYEPRSPNCPNLNREFRALSAFTHHKPGRDRSRATAGPLAITTAPAFVTLVV